MVEGHRLKELRKESNADPTETKLPYRLIDGLLYSVQHNGEERVFLSTCTLESVLLRIGILESSQSGTVRGKVKDCNNKPKSLAM